MKRVSIGILAVSIATILVCLPDSVRAQGVGRSGLDKASHRTVSNGYAVAVNDAGTECTALMTDFDGNANAKESHARAACRDVLLPRQPTPIIETPGSFFVGHITGSKESSLVYGPQVGVAGAVLFPIKRPYLTLRSPKSSTELKFELPEQMSFTFDLAVSLIGNFAGYNIDSGEPTVAEDDTGNTLQSAFNAGLYLGPQIGAAWWVDGTDAKKVSLVLGVLTGFAHTKKTGSGFLIGVQPALVAQF